MFPLDTGRKLNVHKSYGVDMKVYIYGVDMKVWRKIEILEEEHILVTGEVCIRLFNEMSILLLQYLKGSFLSCF